MIARQELNLYLNWKVVAASNVNEMKVNERLSHFIFLDTVSAQCISLISVLLFYIISVNDAATSFALILSIDDLMYQAKYLFTRK